MARELGDNMRLALATLMLLAALSTQGHGQSLADFASGLNGALHPSAGQSARVLIFGGENNRTYLGCLNCGDLDPESVTNEIGRFGSSLSTTSIHNQLGRFGSALSSYSACNELAMHPPVLVDGDGNFYGELTLNQLRPRRIKAPNINAWLAAICHAD
jgi:hypothetical protein